MKAVIPLLSASARCSLFVPSHTARTQGKALTSQGRLDDAAGPANGTYDFQFTVRDAPTNGNTLGVNPLTATLTASNGRFTATLDPGAGVFTGADRWLEIVVRPTGSGAFNTLLPRQQITAAPYAITAGAVTGPINGSSIANVLITGTQLAAGTVTAAQIASNSITAGQLASGAAVTNLNAANQSGVPSGGIILSSNANSAELLNAGYIKHATFALTNSTAGAFSVEYTTNLLDWLFLGPAVPRYKFTETNVPAGSQRYYRLRWP